MAGEDETQLVDFLKQSFEQISLDDLHVPELLEIAKASLHQFGLADMVDTNTQQALVKIYVTKALQEFFNESESKEIFWTMQDKKEMWESSEQVLSQKSYVTWF